MNKILIPTANFELCLPVVFVGLGLSNKATYQLLKHLGLKEEDTLFFDDKLNEFEGMPVFNDSELLKTKKPQSLIVSPGYPLNSNWIQELKLKGVQIESELSIASKFLDGEKVVGITGSLGKSTTTSLLGEALIAAGKSCFVGGNLGYPMASYVLDVLTLKRARADWIVLELSSFQLENLGGFQFDYSLLTYFCPNHLERYKDLNSYYETKATLVKRTRKQVFANNQSSDLLNFFSKNNSDKIIWSDPHLQKYFSNSDWNIKKLVGTHNHENLVLVANLLDKIGLWNSFVKSALLEFRGLSHRMEMVSNQGPIYINDSKSTAMVSVLSAVKSILEEPRFSEANGFLWVLLGGRDKKLPWEDLQELESNTRLKFVFFGECRALAQSKSKLKGTSFEKLETTIRELKKLAQKQDWILLSPGGTSLDEFKNFEDRGIKFANWCQSVGDV